MIMVTHLGEQRNIALQCARGGGRRDAIIQRSMWDRKVIRGMMPFLHTSVRIDFTTIHIFHSEHG